MPNLDSTHLDEQSQGLARSAGLIGLVFVLGVVGYSTLGGPEYGLVDAIYMTMITLTTVGYAEVIDLSDNPGGRLFTTALLVIGVGSFVYFFSNFTAFIVEGNLDRILWRRRMRRSLNAIEHHYIVCGAGRTGQHMIRELIQTERPFVLIDIDEIRARELLDELGFGKQREFPIVIGDATDDEILRAAGIEQAVGLCASLSSDKDNLLITMTARLIRQDLRIVARCADPKIFQKLQRVGADAVVSPNMIGGLRLVSELVRPDAVTFLDTMLRDKEKRLRIEEVQLQAGAEAIGRTLGELRADAIEGLLIIAVRTSGSDKWAFNPGDALALVEGHTVVFMSGPEGRQQAEARWGSGS